MSNDNVLITSVDTDRAIYDILSNFSYDFIKDSIEKSIQYKFRPYSMRMPNLPAILEKKFQAILVNCPDYKDRILDKRSETYGNLIDIVCGFYHLQVTTEIPEEHLFTVANLLYRILVSEFTERMISFFVNYIISHMDELMNYLPDDRKVSRTSYAKKLYSQQEYITVYDNMEQILFNIMTNLDIPMNQLLVYLSDQMSSDILCSYISDCGDLYKNYYVYYLKNPDTWSDMISTIKLNYVSSTSQNNYITNPTQNPYFE